MSGNQLGKSSPGARCLVCGNSVDPSACLREVYEGEERAFCSPACQARFECHPEQFLGDAQSLSRHRGYS